MRNVTTRTRAGRRAVIVATLLAATLTGGCSGGDDVKITKTTDPRSGGSSPFDATTTEPKGSGATQPGGTGAPPTTLAVPSDPGAALQAAVAAYSAVLGTPAIRTLQFMIQFPAGSASYASLQSQDPANPANVDERDWRNGVVGDPAPVRLTGTGALEPNLFSLDEINWSAIAGVVPTAPAAVEAKVGALSNGRGVTHLIAQRDLPFSDHVVVRVYVDGGDHRLGGYVQYLADGSVDKVVA